MKICLWFWSPHIIVINRAISFLNVFAETDNLINIHLQALYGEKHNPMIVKQMNCFLNSSLKRFCKDSVTNKVSGEGIIMS